MIFFIFSTASLELFEIKQKKMASVKFDVPVSPFRAIDRTNYQRETSWQLLEDEPDNS